MDLNFSIFMTWLTFCFYGLASLMGISGLILKKNVWITAGVWGSISAFICQTTLLILGYHKSFASGPSMGAYMQLPAWFGLLCGIVAWVFYRQKLLILFASPLAFILFLISMPTLQTRLNLPVYLSSAFYILHIGALFLSLGMLALAFICSLVFLGLESQIKRKKLASGFWKGMPALAILDRINAACSLFAFPFYTIGIIAGLLWANPLFGSNLAMDPKILTTLVIWVLFAILFHNRLAKNWKGRKPAIFIVLIFSLSLFSIGIINFFFPTSHGFVFS